MNGTVFVLIPPIVIIILVLMTRRVILSVGLGIILASLIYENFNLIATAKRMLLSVIHLFYEDGAIAAGNLYILGFLLLLGVMTGLIQLSGGGAAFGEFAARKFSSKRHVTLSTTAFGMTLFPDDVFNMFTNSQVSRPLFDRFGIPRAKLAYMVHSTSDPLCVLTPVSSWGAYIISIFATIFVSLNISDNPMVTFIEVGFVNFYALTTIALVFLVAFFDINIGKMKKSVQNAQEITAPDNGSKGNIRALVIPILTLMTVSIAMLLWTGYQNSQSLSLISWFENGEVSLALVTGAFFACISSLLFIVRDHLINQLPKAISNGLKTTLPAVWILLFAWVLSELTGLLQTGEYLASFIENIDLSVSWLPFLLFLLTGFMAFSTGTSWGTFAIMLPIAAQIGIHLGADLTPLFAAVLSGSLFGDHCSPISDTTTVAAAAAGCNHMEHVITQIPYALTAAFITACSFLVFGITENNLLAYLTIAVMLISFTGIYRIRNKQNG